MAAKLLHLGDDPKVPPCPANNRKRIFLIDDHSVMRDGLRRLLDEEHDLVVCGEAANSKRGLADIEQTKPDLALIDLSMPGVDGLELIKNIKAQHTDLRMMVLSMHAEELYAERVLRAGAKGYIMKQAPITDLLEAIRAVLRDEIYLSPALASQLLRSLVAHKDKSKNALEKLSDRELEIFRQIGKGYSTREVSFSLAVSAKTVESHRGNIRQKLGLRTGAELVRFAISHRDGEF